MNCQQVNKYIERYDEGSLPPQISFQVEKHLQNCDKCQTLLCLATRERVCLEGDTDIPPLSTDFVQGVMARIQVTSTQDLPPLVPVWVEWTRRYPTLLGAAAVILLFIFPMVSKPNPNYGEVPPAIQYTKKMAAINQAQNIQYSDSALPSRVELEASTYRDETRTVTDEDPSRSLMVPKVGATSEKKEAMTAAPPLQALAAGKMQDETIPAVLPGYIPSGYILDKTTINEDNSVTIQYLAADNQSAEPLVLNIAPEKRMLKAKGLTGAGAGDIESSKVRALAAPTADQANYNLEDKDKLTNMSAAYQEYGYILTTNLPLTSEEMENLSHSLEPAKP